MRTIYASTFTFAMREVDEEFHALDKTIADAAKSIPGYLGDEAWENPSLGLISNVYYWDSMEALQALMTHPAHLEAKRRQAEWLNGYHVVIAQVVGPMVMAASPIRSRTSSSPGSAGMPLPF